MATVTVSLTDQEQNTIKQLFDAAVRSQGLVAAQLAFQILAKIEMANQQSSQEMQAGIPRNN